MSDPATISNYALSHLGTGIEIQDFINEKSQEAQACRRFYEQVRQEMLREFPWPFAKTTVTLALVAGPNPPATTEWQCSYRLPVDCLRARRILSGARQDTQSSRIPYLLGRDAQGGLIYTDSAPVAATSTAPGTPLFEYTALVTDEMQYQPDFVQAMSFKLAFYMAPRLTKGDQFRLGERAFQQYLLFLERAKDAAMNEEQPDRSPESEFILERDSGMLLPPTPIIRSI